MSKQRMAGNMDVLQKAEQMNNMFRQKHQRIKSIMDRQRQRDMAATQGQIIPFSRADIF